MSYWELFLKYLGIAADVAQLTSAPAFAVVFVVVWLIKSFFGQPNMNRPARRAQQQLSWWAMFKIAYGRLPKPKKYQFNSLCALALLIFALDVYGYFAPHAKRDEKFPAECLMSYGTEPPGAVSFPGPWDQKHLWAEADGRCFSEYKDKYEITTVALHQYADQDLRDQKFSAKGFKHEIVDADITMLMDVSDQFLYEARRGAKGTTYILLLVPKKIGMDQFSTLRQAADLDVIKVRVAGGPP